MNNEKLNLKENGAAPELLRTETDEPTTFVKAENQIEGKKYTIFTMIRNVLILIAFLLVVYIFSPFEIVTIGSNSMDPALQVGDVMLAQKTNEDTEYQVGDIVTFSVEYGGTYYARVTHRIVAIDGDIVTTKGDHNLNNDPFTINVSQIRNRVRYRIAKNIFKGE